MPDYSFERLPQVVNLRGKLPHDGWYNVYPESVKTDIAIHHSLTDSGDSEAFARYHVYTHGWPEVAYHFVILKDGTIEYNHQLGVLSYHVGNSNKQAVGICLVGDFRDSEPTEAQKESLRQLHECLVNDMPNYQRTRGHNEFPGYSWKACPEFDYKAVINHKGYLARGDEGDRVRELQEKLVSLGYSIAVDGHYGPNTEKAVKGFQRAHNLRVDGYYGQYTQDTLEEALKRYHAVSIKKDQEEINMKETGFKDVAPGQYYTDAIKWLKEQEITQGIGDGKFGVGQNIKREDVAVMLYRAFNEKK